MIDWPEIVRQYGPMVWRTAYRLLNQEADAADCFQQTFLSVVQLAQKETIRSWLGVLKRVATTRALEMLRNQQRRQSRLQEWDDEAISSCGSNRAEHNAMTNELTECLRLALSEIDSKQAQVFCLICLEEQSYQDVAEQLEITVNHVGVLLNRSKASLRTLLQDFSPSLDSKPFSGGSS